MDKQVRPTLRGVLHHWSAFVAFGAGAVLVAMAPSARAAWAGGVYAASLVVLFAVSATYHRVTWSPTARAWMRRADHASIFLLIAGTYTPVVLVAMPPEVGKPLLTFVWCGAVVGILQSLFWIGAPKIVTALLCLALGWSLVPYIDDVRRALDRVDISLILGGGLAYSLGAIAYAAKRPNLKPGVFGYHEFFHACTLVGAALHFTAVLRIIRMA